MHPEERCGLETRPEIDLEDVIVALERAYGIVADDIAFLPVGADPDAAAWRVAAADGATFFLKTRHARFNAGPLAVPRFLCDQGIGAVVAPLRDRHGALSVIAGGVGLILYPFVEGMSGFEGGALTPRQWTRLGAALRNIHDAKPPAAVLREVETELFAPRWREQVRGWLRGTRPARDDTDRALSTLLDRRHGDVERILERADELALLLRDDGRPLVLCHTDIHAGNVLTGRDGGIHIVDWDSPRLAPKERDLMFVGGGVGGVWNHRDEEEAFYRGYDATVIDVAALAYYRCERIVEDIAVTCEQVFLGDGPHRAESLSQLEAQWRPRDVVEIADATFRRLARRDRFVTQP